MKSIDWQTILFCAGRGGRGGLSFDRGAHIPYGKPNGGNGAQGASIVLRANRNVPHLGNLKSLYMAPNGINGKNKLRHGKKPDDMIVEVPLGTVAKLYQRIIPETEKFDPFNAMRAHIKKWSSSVESDDTEERYIGEIDMVESGFECTIAKGGFGGKGNPHFSTPGNSPRISGPGLPGQIIKAILELKSLADVGLVGYPNSGKSSLVQILTNSNSQIGDYEFTTLHPSIGICLHRDYFNCKSDKRIPDSLNIRIADIPGLIRGASENKGLGHQFLKHIERCKMLLIVIDVYPEYTTSLNFEESTLVDNYNTIINELAAYNLLLLGLPRAIVFNKIDLITDRKVQDRLDNTITILGEKESILKCSTISKVGIYGDNGVGNYVINKNSLL